MNSYLMCFLCVLLNVHAYQYVIYSSPCPQTFHYELVGDEWIGVAEVDALPLGNIMKFEVILSLNAPVVTFLHPSYPARMLVSNEENFWQNFHCLVLSGV